ncbi:MAG TPA: SRPBCC family protein [Gemmatimonadaceae bacterium]
MARIELTTSIAAPPERCFDLARSVEFHIHTSAATDERAVDGKRSGLLEMGDTVTWEARHFGVRQRLSVQMSAFDRPRHFQDVMVRGAFARLTHDHYFDANGSGTAMRDMLEFAAPLGPLGRLVEVLVLESYLRRFLEHRSQRLKLAAESSEWTKFLKSER